MRKMEQAQAQPLLKRRAAAGSASVPLAGRLWNMPAWQPTVADGGGGGWGADGGFPWQHHSLPVVDRCLAGPGAG